MRVRADDHSPPPINFGDALFLDLDGTLAEIAASPHKVTVDPRIPAILLQAAERLDGALAVISGRPIAQIDRLLRPYAGAVAGIHGLERRDASGRTMASAAAPELDHARRVAAEFAAEHAGVTLEDKGLALALHYRGGPEHGAACRVVARAVATGRLTTQEGKMVIEIQPDGMDKGRTIRTYMDELPFRGRRPIYIGDDRPDEAGFDYVNKAGGLSVLVGPAFQSIARYRLAGVAEAIAWLDQFAFGAPALADTSA